MSSERSPESAKAKAVAPRPPWRDLLGDASLRRLARLAALREEDRVVWIGPAEDRSADRLEKIAGCTVERHLQLTALPERSLGLLVAPTLVAEQGLEAALRALRPALDQDGVAAVVVRVFIGSEVPSPLREYWEKLQPEPLRSVKQSFERLAAVGFEPLTSELLEEPSPAEHDAELLSEIARETSGEALAEAASGLRHGTSLSLLVGRRVEAGAPPRWPRRGGGE